MKSLADNNVLSRLGYSMQHSSFRHVGSSDFREIEVAK